VSWYVDTSAFVKLIIDEPESVAMRAWWHGHHPSVFSSELLRTETLHATRRISPEAEAAGRVVLDTIDLLSFDLDAYEEAGTLEPVELRTLDALHLVAALAAGDDLDGVVTYDDPMAKACRARGIATAAPA